MNNFQRIKNLTFKDFIKLNNNAYEVCLISLFNSVFKENQDIECPAMNGREDDITCIKCWEKWLKKE